MHLVLRKFIPFTILLLTIKSMVLPILYNYSFGFGPTWFWWFVSVVLLASWYLGIKYFTPKGQRRLMWPVATFLFWNVICITRGLFIADDYWSWKALFNNAFALLLPGVAYVVTNVRLTQQMFRVYIKYATPLLVLFVFYLRAVYYEYVLILMLILFLFFPLLIKRHKVFLGLAVLLLLLSELTARGAVIKAAVVILLVGVYYLRFFIGKRTFSLLHNILMLLPVFLFITAVLGFFNPFKLDKLVEKEIVVEKVKMDGSTTEESLTIDTRSVLYEEVLRSALKFDYIAFGRSPARGNETKVFSSLAKITGRKERFGNEAAILNVFTWTGIVGVILYFVLFFHASHVAINKSNNIFSKIIGLMLAFRWIYSWVSDENHFHLMYFSIFLLVGLCYSHEFRKMTTGEVMVWIRGVFSLNYRRIWIKYIKNNAKFNASGY